MTSTAHFYSPKDDSLEERLRAFQGAYQAWLDVEASFHFYDQEGWEDRLGSKEDLLSAKEIAENTLDMAVLGLSGSEIEMAIDQRLISEGEADYFLSQQGCGDKSLNDTESIIEARKKEIGDIRKERSHEHSKNRGFDRS